MDADIVIIGAGLSGLSTAYYLSSVTTDVIVVEADRVCYGASGRNTGKITAQHGLLYKQLIETYGKQFAAAYYQANIEAIDSIEAIVHTHAIDCDFQRCNSTLFTQDALLCADLQDEYQAYLDLHIPCHYEEETQDPIPTKARLHMHYQAKYNPYAYGVALRQIIQDTGMQVFEHSPVDTMLKDDDGGYIVIVNEKKIHANKVIFTSQFPFIDHGHFYFTKMYCEQERIVHATLKTPLPNLMMRNIETPLHSYNTYHTDIFIGGNSYKSGQTPEVSKQAFLSHIYKSLPIHKIDSDWSSQDYITFDKIPFIGKLDKHDENVLFASGFNKWGNTNSNLAGKLLCAYALHQGSQYREVYTPQRSTTFFSFPFLKENLNVAYEFIKGKMKPDDQEYPSIQQGKKMQIDNHTYGVYRDENDALFIVDITCPHMGCVCSFNAIDKTWDCPCHGSRFSYTGEIIKGPATHRLRAYGDGLNTIDPHI